MLRVSVGLSRKITRNYNSTGYSIHLEGEVGVDLDDRERTLEKIRELYRLAGEALRDQIDRDPSGVALATPPVRSASRSSVSSPNQHAPGVGDDRPATGKQIRYLHAIVRRQGLSQPALEAIAAQTLGRDVVLEDLSRSDVGAVIERLTAEAAERVQAMTAIPSATS